MDKIIFSENCYRYIIRFTFEDENGNIMTTYFYEPNNDTHSVHSTISVWCADRFFSLNDAKEMLTFCNEVWPEGNGKICKVFMSAPVEL